MPRSICYGNDGIDSLQVARIIALLKQMPEGDSRLRIWCRGAV